MTLRTHSRLFGQSLNQDTSTGEDPAMNQITRRNFVKTLGLGAGVLAAPLLLGASAATGELAVEWMDPVAGTITRAEPTAGGRD